MECKDRSQSTCSIELNKNISFYGMNGRPVIKCKKNCQLFVIKNLNLKFINVTFDNLVFTSADAVTECTTTSGFQVVLRNTIITDNNVGIHSRSCENCFIDIHNSTFKEKTNWAIWFKCTNLKASITNSIFKRNPILLQTIQNPAYENLGQTMQVFVRNSIFDGQYTTLLTTLLSIKPYGHIVDISILDSEFLNHQAMAAVNYEVSSLSIIDYNQKRMKTYISLRNIRVENSLNRRPAVTLQTIFNMYASFAVEIRDSLFKNNSAALKLQIINVIKSSIENSAVIVRNNTFAENFGGKDSLNSIPAILFFGGKYQVTSCRFLDNKAGQNPFSAVVTVSELTVVAFRECYFENSQTTSAATQFYARGQSTVTFKGKNTFNILALKTGQAVFLRIPLYRTTGLVIKDEFKVLCPQGYRSKNKKTCDVRESNLYCTYIYLTCTKCPAKTYALERAKFVYNVSNHVKCMLCPRGGNCVNGIIKARPNFWGYKSNNKSITFAQCPPGYCCHSTDCVRYDSCHGNRTGTLCGRCPKGMSDSLFTSQCTSNTRCTGSLFIPWAIAILVL